MTTEQHPKPPPEARLKTLHTYGSENLMVWVHETTEEGDYKRTIQVWSADLGHQGTYLGCISTHRTETERRLYGRVSSLGKPFTAWAGTDPRTGRTDYYMKHRSQADAIRPLVSKWENTLTKDQRRRLWDSRRNEKVIADLKRRGAPWWAG